MKSSAAKVQMMPFDSIFGDKDENGFEKKDGIQEISLSELHPFRNHPFKVVDNEEMQKLVDSIKEHGVLVPAIVRQRAESGYELISGHRRHRASQLAGLKTMPAIIEDLDDDSATIIMVDSNLQRENILPSERAYAYKLKLEAMKRQGKRTDLTSAQVGPKLTGKTSADILGEQVGESRNQVKRFIRLTELVPKLLDMVDNKKIPMNPAVELSFLKKDEQFSLLEVIEMEETTPSISQAQRMKKYSQEGKLTEDIIDAILTENKAVPEKVTLSRGKLGKYFPATYTSTQMEAIILELLNDWKKRQDEN